jgi:hypothetical protein
MHRATARAPAAPAVRTAVALQSLVLLVGGAALFAFPAETSPGWPWEVPPLAARFLGASLTGIGVAVLLILLDPSPGARTVLALMGTGLLLAPITGIIPAGAEVDVPGLAILAIVLLAFATADLLLAPAGRTRERIPADQAHPTGVAGRGAAGSARLPVGLRVLLGIHLALVAPVGLAMFIVPGLVGPEWPWPLSDINVRLLGSIFLGAAPVSAIAMRARTWSDVRPVLAAYAVFSTLSLVAIAAHLELFDPERTRTWVFIVLYAAVGGASAGGLLISVLPRSQTQAA